jgi:hypothetical protein
MAIDLRDSDEYLLLRGEESSNNNPPPTKGRLTPGAFPESLSRRNHLHAQGAVDVDPDGRTASGTRTIKTSGSAAWLIYTIYSTSRRSGPLPLCVHQGTGRPLPSVLGKDQQTNIDTPSPMRSYTLPVIFVYFFRTITLPPLPRAAGPWHDTGISDRRPRSLRS